MTEVNPIPDTNLNCRVVQLPKALSELKPLLRKYVSLRLQALKESPESFLSTFEEESRFSDTEWLERLQRSDVHIFVCQTRSEVTINGVPRCEDEWIGMISLRGPIPHAEYTKLPSKLPNSQYELDTCWLLYHFYTSRRYRLSGVGLRLFTEAASFVSARTDFLAKAYIRGMIRWHLRSLINAYCRYGFDIVGSCTLEDGFRSIQEPIPASMKAAIANGLSDQGCVVEYVLKREPKEEKTTRVGEIRPKL